MALTRTERTALIWTIGFLTFGGLLKAHQEHEVRWGKAFMAPPPDASASIREDSLPLRSPQQPSETGNGRGGLPSQSVDSAALAGRKTGPERVAAGPETPMPEESSAPIRPQAPVCPLSMNDASVEQWTGLPGIGPKMAETIVRYRREHGPFRKVGDLDKVKGIGQKKLDRIRSCLIL